MPDATQAFIDALTGDPDDTRIGYLEALLTDLEQASVAKNYGDTDIDMEVAIEHPDPDGFALCLRESRELARLLRAALDAAKGA